MTQRTLGLALFAVGILGLLFSLSRTYYLVWKLRKGREPLRKKQSPPADE